MKWFQKLIGIDNIYNQINDLNRYITGLRGEAAAIKHNITVHNAALARIIAKLDPMYGVSEFDPDRIAASKKIEDEIIAKLNAEQSVLESKGYAR